MYSASADLVGLYTKHDKKSILAESKVYTEDLPASMIKPLKPMNYTVILGNDASGTFGVEGSFFREVKIWDKPQSFAYIKNHLFKQIKDAPVSLLSYVKLAENFPVFKDFGFGDGTIDEEVDLVNSEKEGANSFQVCAFPLYHSLFDKGKCKQNPFVAIKLY